MLLKTTCLALGLMAALVAGGASWPSSEGKTAVTSPRTSPGFIYFKPHSTEYAQAGAPGLLKDFFTKYQDLARDSPGLSISLSYYLCDAEKAVDPMLAYRRADKIMTYARRNHGIERLQFVIRDIGENTILGKGCGTSGLRLWIVP
jgi:hypothetical protein